MNRKRLALLGGLVVVAVLALRRRRRRDAVEVEIDERPMRSVAIDEPESRGATTVADGPSIELESIEGIGSAYAARLREAGVEDGADLLAADAADLAAETGVGEGRIRTWVERVEESGNG